MADDRRMASRRGWPGIVTQRPIAHWRNRRLAASQAERRGSECPRPLHSLPCQQLPPLARACLSLPPLWACDLSGWKSPARPSPRPARGCQGLPTASYSLCKIQCRNWGQKSGQPQPCWGFDRAKVQELTWEQPALQSRRVAERTGLFLEAGEWRVERGASYLFVGLMWRARGHGDWDELSRMRGEAELQG